MKKRPLMREFRKRTDKIIGSYDIETNGFFGTYLDGFLKYSDDEQYYRASSMEEMFELILKRWDVILYAHNGAGYEHNYLIDVLKKRNDLNIQLIVAGSKVIAIIIYHPENKKRTIELRDSLALFDPSTSLKKACIAFGVKGGKTDIGLSEGIIYDPKIEEHVQYCKNDVRCTIDVIRNYSDSVYNIFASGIGITSASTSLSNWKTTIGINEKYYRLPSKIEEFVRNSYFGAFVYPGRSINVQKDIISVDRTAAYAASMREGVPYGKPVYTTVFSETSGGIYYCYVESPSFSETFLPIIPYRNNGTLKWGYGNFFTYITSKEYQFARTQNYKLVVIEGYIFPEWIYPFNDFINKCENIELNEPDKKPTIKLSRNALYGKFGTKLETEEYRIGEPTEGEWTPLVDEETGEINFSVYFRKIRNEANYIMPHWASFITAQQRIWLMKHMIGIGIENVVYGDTDSIKAKRSAVEKYLSEGHLSLNSGYGNVKIDEEYEWFQCLGPKVYFGQLTDGKDKMRAKGVPYRQLTPELFKDAYNNVFNSVEYVSSNSTLTRIKNPDKEMRILAHRCLTNIRNSNSWILNENGDILPPFISEECT